MVHLRPESYNTVCPRPESCDMSRALMSVTPNLCSDETELRSIHSPDVRKYAIESENTIALGTHCLEKFLCISHSAISVYISSLYHMQIQRHHVSHTHTHTHWLKDCSHYSVTVSEISILLCLKSHRCNIQSSIRNLLRTNHMIGITRIWRFRHEQTLALLLEELT